MGLGQVKGQEDMVDDQAAEEPKQEEERLVIEDKNGKRRTITDRSAMYVDEAWVGRGPYRQGFDYRGRGRAFRLRLPYTSKSSSSLL